MDDATRNARRIRQLLSIDQWLGLDATPLGTPPEAPTPESAQGPAAASADHAGSSAASSRPRGSTSRSPRGTAPAAPAAPPPASAIEQTLGPDQRSREEKAAALRELEQEVAAFLAEHWPPDGWTHVVFGEGDPDADLMFIGEAPGAEEDRLGRPFVGRAGQLLDKQIGAMGLAREQVYIANIGKARPPGNRVPTPEEAEKMMPFLVRQVEIIRPKAIVTLGATSAKYLLGEQKLAITRERGKWRQFRGVPLMPTFHPAYLLRQYTVENRGRVWSDLQQVMQHLGLPLP